MQTTAPTNEADMVIDLKNLVMEGYSDSGKHRNRTKNRIVAVIRSNDVLNGVELDGFKFRLTNKDVRLAYFKLEKRAEKIARANAREWIEGFLKGAKLIEPTWYSVKIDFVETLIAMDPEIRGVNQDARESLSEKLYEDKETYKVLENEYGSDHRAVYTAIDMAMQQT